MGDQTPIAWTDATWNPVVGCSKVSAGCQHCYAEALTRRFHRPGFQPWTAPHAVHNVALHPERLDRPRHWRRPRRVFVNSMSDLFHERVPDVFLAQVWAVMADTPHHTYQVLTKRPERMRDWVCRLAPDPLPNVWLGTSVEQQRWVDVRVGALLETPAAIRFLSCEPLLGPLDLSAFAPFSGECFCQERSDGCRPRQSPDCPTVGVDWVIVGGESGPGARPMDPAWVRDLRDQCQAAGVPFFFKQWGGSRPGGPAELDGRVCQAWPRPLASRVS